MWNGLTVLGESIAELPAALVGRVLRVHVEVVVQHLGDVLQGPLAGLARDAVRARVQVLLRRAQAALPEPQALDGGAAADAVGGGDIDRVALGSGVRCGGRSGGAAFVFFGTRPRTRDRRLGQSLSLALR